MTSNSHLDQEALEILRHFGMYAKIFGLDGNRPTCKCLIQALCRRIDCHPWALDFGIHAEMTGLRAKMRIAGQ